jgi:hypothetical protein
VVKTGGMDWEIGREGSRIFPDRYYPVKSPYSSAAPAYSTADVGACGALPNIIPVSSSTGFPFRR